jgi:arabinan endo-1,5-alpha-L-arabinosidase
VDSAARPCARLAAYEAEADVREATRGVVAAMRTPDWAQRLAADGLGLQGKRRLMLENDLEWEGHLMEGIWVARHGGRHYLFYSGNDFSTALWASAWAVSQAPRAAAPLHGGVVGAIGGRRDPG